jgi:hypothetical protein
MMLSGFNFWMVISARTMAVDNASVTAMDFSSLPTSVQMIQWREGRGEIEATSGPALRTVFTDVTPYCALFQQFMTLLPGLTLAQAQQIQVELISLLYNNKRQLPFNFTISSGNYNWGALDGDIAGMTMAYLSAGDGGLVGQINDVVGQINDEVVAPLNTSVMSAGNFLKDVNGDTGECAGPGLATPMTGVSGVAPSATIAWVPLWPSGAVNLTSQEMTALMAGLTSRRNTLMTTFNTKKAAIAGMTAVSAVIAYDVTAGW